MTIRLAEIWPIAAPQLYKIHFARWNGDTEPLEVFASDKQEWQSWQEYRPGRNDFNRPLIFSLIQFHHEPDVWLFGGVFRVLARHIDRYEVELSEEGEGFLGRLKLRSSYRERTTRVNLENHYNGFEVQEILREPYSGRSFPGFESIDLSFEELETLVRNNRPDWQGALSKVNGVYLITDTVTGRRYVGSASGDEGVWSRWNAYVATGHGGNVELRNLVTDRTLNYCRKAFRFALLEVSQRNTPTQLILAREGYWKQVLQTRGEQGLNRN